MEMAETENGILYRVEHAEKKVESPAGDLTILRRKIPFSVTVPLPAMRVWATGPQWKRMTLFSSSP